MSEGGYAELTLTPHGKNRTEVRLGNRRFFDLVRVGPVTLAEFKPVRHQVVFVTLEKLMECIADYYLGEDRDD